MKPWNLPCLIAFLSLAPLSVGVADDTVATIDPDPPIDLIDTRALDLEGQVHSLGAEKGNRGVAIVFLDTLCPISNRYAPELSKLARTARDQNVAFYGVISDPTVTRAEARAFRDDYGLAFPVLFDASSDLADRLQPERVPYAFVIDPADRLVYRGRIDNRFVANGKLRQQITAHDLRDAIAAVARGERPAVAETEAIGCDFEAWGDTLEEAKVTYTRDIAPLLNAHCVECHRPGDIGPFPLTDYASAKRRARTLARVTSEGFMPPWHAEPGFGAFKDERVLSQRQIDLLEAWVAAGSPEGDPADLPPPPVFPEGEWRLGEPDRVIAMTEPFSVPAEGDDIYRYFVIPKAITRNRDLVAVDFKPGDPTVVHHAIFYADHSGKAQREAAKDTSGPGFSVFGGGGGFMETNTEAYAFGGWAPGSQPYQLPEGLGIPLYRGADVVIEVHYHLSGKATTDQSEVALYFADKPVERHVDGLILGTFDVAIEPGDADYRRHVWMDVPAAMTLIDIGPHMHYLATEVEAAVTYPDGTVEPLLKITNWDFRWQDIYVYREPLEIPAGSRIDAWFRYDNSADNPFNPVHPPQAVKWGWETTDEMCEIYLTVVPDKPRDSAKLHRAANRAWDRSADPDQAAAQQAEHGQPKSWLSRLLGR